MYRVHVKFNLFTSACYFVDADTKKEMLETLDYLIDYHWGGVGDTPYYRIKFVASATGKQVVRHTDAILEFFRHNNSFRNYDDELACMLYAGGQIRDIHELRDKFFYNSYQYKD